MCHDCRSSYRKRMLNPDKWEIYSTLDDDYTIYDINRSRIARDKRQLEEMIGFGLEDNVVVKCDNCGSLHTFQADAFTDISRSQDSHMGLRTEHVFRIDEPCEKCGSLLSCTALLSEYPPATIEGKPVYKYIGCSKAGPQVQFEYKDYSPLFNDPYIADLYIPHDIESVNVRPELILDGGVARLFDDGKPINTRTKIYVPVYGELLEILTDETGTLTFSADGPRLSGLIEKKSPKEQAMKVLGSVAEAIIVHECAESEEKNKKWLDIARRGNSRMDTVRKHTAIGTGLNSTKRMHPRKYDKNNPQRDIIWIDADEREALVIGGSAVSSLPAGLQVKTSTDGVGYVQPDLVKRRYEVPVVYFPINDDYDSIVRNLVRKAAAGEIDPVEIGVDFINGKVVDWDAYVMLKESYSILEALYSGRMSEKEFVSKASGIIPLENAVMANILKEGVSKILTVR